jgi:hypothetical protein
MTSGVAISHWPANHAACVHRDRSYRTAATDSEWLTAAPSGRGFVRRFKYQCRSRHTYSEHRSHSLARRTPSGVRDEKPASWNARPALTRSQRLCAPIEWNQRPCWTKSGRYLLVLSISQFDPMPTSGAPKIIHLTGAGFQVLSFDSYTAAL